MERKPMRLGENRDEVLDFATSITKAAWQSFDQARLIEPVIDLQNESLLSQSAPEFGTDPLIALNEASSLLNQSLAHARPRFLAYVGSSGLEIGAIADLLVGSYDINMALAAGAATRVENQTVQWVSEFVGYECSGGWFTSGGTISNMNALVAARESALPGSRINGLLNTKTAMYCSQEVHYSIVRAAEMMGLGSASLRKVEIVKEGRGLNPLSLEELIRSDLEAGVVPICVIATAGTTLTGAIDPINAIADICDKYGIWLHIDGAYGLPAASTSRAPLFVGLNRADSVSVDAHKWMYVPKACSILMIKNQAPFARAFGHNEAYIPHQEEILNPVDMTLEYSRPFRALKLWLALRVHGMSEFRSALEANLTQAQYCYEKSRASGQFEVLPFPPVLSTVPIRHIVEGCPDIDTHNRELALAIMKDGSSYVSPAVIDGQQWLRPCFTNIRTTLGDVDVFLESALNLGNALCPAHGGAL